MTFARLILFLCLGIEHSVSSPLAFGARRPELDVLHSEPLDSVVLQRTKCFGWCEAYRLVIDKASVAHFVSLDSADSGRTASGAAASYAIQNVYQLTVMVHFIRLPDTIESSPLCGPRATDNPTVITGIYGPSIQKRVVDYKGCLWAPGLLDDLENLIDSLAVSSRWRRAGSYSGEPGL
jgi:hypothetical protein